MGPLPPPPPPTSPTGPDAALIRGGLARLRAASPSRFETFFLRGRPLRITRRERPLFAALSRAGLARPALGPFWSPSARVVPFAGHLLAADLLRYAGVDQVFTPMFEQVYFVRNMQVGEGDRVLDIGVGSGVLSLFAAARARHVTGVDTNPRALAFARFNRALNPGGAPIDLRLGSFFEPLDADARFDLVMANPPFEPVPPGAAYFRHSDGGEDGLDVVRVLLEHVPDRLQAHGRLEMVTWSPGSASRPLLLNLLGRAFPSHRQEIHLLEQWPIEVHLDRFARHEGYAAWRDRLAARSLTDLYFLFVRVGPAGERRAEIRRPEAEVAACRAVAAEWLA